MEAGDVSATIAVPVPVPVPVPVSERIPFALDGGRWAPDRGFVEEVVQTPVSR